LKSFKKFSEKAEEKMKLEKMRQKEEDDLRKKRALEKKKKDEEEYKLREVELFILRKNIL
jgi:hypothetical protein